MIEFEILARFALREMTDTERNNVWEKIKNDGDSLTLVEDIEYTIEEHNLKSLQDVLNWYHKKQDEFEQFMHQISDEEITFSKLMDEVLGILNPPKDDVDELLDFLPRKSKEIVTLGDHDDQDPQFEKLKNTLKGKHIDRVKRLFAEFDSARKNTIVNVIWHMLTQKNSYLIGAGKENEIGLLRLYLDGATEELLPWTEYFESNPEL